MNDLLRMKLEMKSWNTYIPELLYEIKLRIPSNREVQDMEYFDANRIAELVDLVEASVLLGWLENV